MQKYGDLQLQLGNKEKEDTFLAGESGKPVSDAHSCNFMYFNYHWPG